MALAGDGLLRRGGRILASPAHVSSGLLAGTGAARRGTAVASLDRRQEFTVGISRGGAGYCSAALPIGILTVRYPGWFSSLLERVAYLGFALPGIAIALGLVFFGANFAPFIYQTLGILILAYGILFLPAALGAVRASLLQISPGVEQSARSLGRTPLGVVVSVTLPLARPGILAGGALVFLLTMKELPATLILSPIGFQTLAQRHLGRGL